jgi:hypothetical protein
MRLSWEEHLRRAAFDSLVEPTAAYETGSSVWIDDASGTLSFQTTLVQQTLRGYLALGLDQPACSYCLRRVHC